MVVPFLVDDRWVVLRKVAGGWGGKRRRGGVVVIGLKGLEWEGRGRRLCMAELGCLVCYRFNTVLAGWRGVQR